MIRVPTFDELLLLTLQSEEDKQLQDELEMLVERLGVSQDVTTGRSVVEYFPFVYSISF